MKDSNRKLIPLLWTVVAVVLLGSGIAVGLLMHKTDDLQQTNTDLTGDNGSLREQLRQAKNPTTPTPTPTPVATTAPGATTTTPTPATTPTPTTTPKVSTAPKP